jgi:hypothetical protein
MKKGVSKKEVLCPWCPGNDWVRPSRLCWHELLFLAIGFRPYRCMICFRRFYAFRRRGDFTKAAL